MASAEQLRYVTKMFIAAVNEKLASGGASSLIRETSKSIRSITTAPLGTTDGGKFKHAASRGLPPSYVRREDRGWRDMTGDADASGAGAATLQKADGAAGRFFFFPVAGVSNFISSGPFATRLLRAALAACHRRTGGWWHLSSAFARARAQGRLLAVLPPPPRPLV